MAETIKPDSGEKAYLKLGFGKGYYYNSVGLEFYDTDKDLFLNFLKNQGFGKIFKNGRMEDFDLNPDAFPLTKPVDANTMWQLGWVKLELKN